MTVLRDAALEYAAAGLPLFPCEPRGKRPLTRHGFLEATTDRGQVAAWWQRWPRANIGLTTGPGSGWYVVDLDDVPGAESWAGLARPTRAPGDP